MATPKYLNGQKVTILANGHAGVVRSYDDQTTTYLVSNFVTGNIDKCQEVDLGPEQVPQFVPVMPGQ